MFLGSFFVHEGFIHHTHQGYLRHLRKSRQNADGAQKIITCYGGCMCFSSSVLFVLKTERFLMPSLACFFQCNHPNV